MASQPRPPSLVALAAAAAALLLISLASPCESYAPPPSSPFRLPVASGGSTSAPSPSTRLYVDGQGMAAGTTRHLVGDVLRSLRPRYLARVADAVRGNVRGAPDLDLGGVLDALGGDGGGDGNAPSWDELGARLRRSQAPAERRFRDDLASGSGPPSALADLRLFGGDGPRVVLYRDSASWCPYCQKVWIALEERRVPYEVRRVDMRCYGVGKPAEFMRIQDSGNLPCAVLDGTTVIGESDDILAAVDAMGDDEDRTKSLRPPEGTEEAELVRRLCDDGRNSLERRLYARWMYYLTGVRKPAEYRRLYEEHLDEVDSALASASGPFFLGGELSIVDIKFIPFVERQEASLAYFKGFRLRDADRWPNLVRWLEAMESRDSYMATKSDWYTHSRALPPQLAADCAFGEGCDEMREAIDAVPAGDADDGAAEEDHWAEPGWDLSARALAPSRREAVERLLGNRWAVVRFACRGAGLPGLPASSAPLADPRSSPNGGAGPAADLMLRHAAEGLLSRGGRARGGGAVGDGAAEAAEALASTGCGGGPEAAEAVADCLDYLRARIGVPRDMSYPAARELRLELRDVAGELRRAAAGAVVDSGTRAGIEAGV